MPQALEDNHPYYRMDLWMEATDTDADEQRGTDGAPIPHLSKSKETFSFLIVPESVLLMKIGEDEGKQYAALNKRFQELQEKAQALDVGVHNIERPDVQVKDLLAPSTRAEQSNETIENCLATTREVYSNYQRMVARNSSTSFSRKRSSNRRRGSSFRWVKSLKGRRVRRTRNIGTATSRRCWRRTPISARRWTKRACRTRTGSTPRARPARN